MTQPLEKTDRKNGKCPGLTLLLSHLQAGLLPADIAKMYGVTIEAVKYNVKKHGIDLKAFRSWKETKADALSFVQNKVVESALEKIPDTGFRDLITGFGVLNNAERLERGQTTSNLNLSSMAQSLAELEKQEADLKALLETVKKAEGGNPPPDEETVEPVPSFLD